MDRHPITRVGGGAVLVVVALLTLASCSDDAVSAPLDPTPDATTVAPIDSSSDTAGTTAPPRESAGDDRSAGLIGEWTIVNYSLVDSGALTNIVGDVTPYLEFRADGTLEFHTGCNGGSATWEASGAYAEPSPLSDAPAGQPIRIGDIGLEQELCDGFLGEQDSDVAANLGAAERFLLVDGGLSLLDEFVLILAEPS